MTDRVSQLRERVGAWITRAQAMAWFGEAELRALQQVERHTPADLFTRAQPARPLVVAFFGGTGVGKSSLLNRLAGQTIARVGVERPTSHEVTVYVHEAVELATLPAHFPVQQVHIARHADAARRDILWIDMPDIDSIEQGNREQVFAWLPHIDLLVYVISPERYRDDIGWRVLRRRGHRHGWMFVMNHWDEGAPEQEADLLTILHEAGFADPLVLHTCCGDTACPDDRFAELEASIKAVQTQHGLQELERLGHLAHLQDLATLLQAALPRLGRAADWQRTRADFQRQWSQTAVAITDGMSWPIQEVAAEFASRDAGLLARLLGDRTDTFSAARQGEEETLPARRRFPEHQATTALWDAWAQGKVVEICDTLEIALHRIGVAPQPLLSRLQPAVEGAAQTVNQRLQQSLRQGLARPGTAVQRSLRRITGAALNLLPMAALLWVSYQVVTGFLHGATGQAAYLGADFAINSILLVVVAWLLPYLLHRRLRPSTETTVIRALRTGFELGLEELGGQIQTALAAASAEREDLLAEAGKLFDELDRHGGAPHPAPGSAVARLLTSQGPPGAATAHPAPKTWTAPAGKPCRGTGR
jgi:50S ribosome-binding GTPase